jgi:hypothetical protein
MRLLSIFKRFAQPSATAPTSHTAPIDVEALDDDGGGWYVPRDGDRSRFVGADGMPSLRLIQYRDQGGEQVLRLCEDSTGLLVGPTDMRLPHAGIFISQLRGEWYHQDDCRAGDFRPGQPVRLAREPANPHDSNAVAVYDATGQHLAAYVNKQKARQLSKLIDAGKDVVAVSIRGTGARVPCEQVAILAADPAVLQHLLSPRPVGAPKPAHLRG